MELEVLSAEILWEAKRVAAAFEVTQWKSGVGRWTVSPNRDRDMFEGIIVGSLGTLFLQWHVGHEGWFGIFLSQVSPSGTRRSLCQLAPVNRGKEGPRRWRLFPTELGREVMARGLYRLDFEDEGILAELNSPLTAHEKMEARLSLPREFWPQRWLDEENSAK